MFPKKNKYLNNFLFRPQNPIVYKIISIEWNCIHNNYILFFYICQLVLIIHYKLNIHQSLLVFWHDYIQSNNARYFITKQGRRWRRSGSTLTDDDTADDKIDSVI